MENFGEILIYQTDNGLSNIEVKLYEETVWLTKQQMAELFQTSFRRWALERLKEVSKKIKKNDYENNKNDIKWGNIEENENNEEPPTPHRGMHR